MRVLLALLLALLAIATPAISQPQAEASLSPYTVDDDIYVDTQGGASALGSDDEVGDDDDEDDDGDDSDDSDGGETDYGSGSGSGLSSLEYMLRYFTQDQVRYPAMLPSKQLATTVHYQDTRAEPRAQPGRVSMQLQAEPPMGTRGPSSEAPATEETAKETAVAATTARTSPPPPPPQPSARGNAADSEETEDEDDDVGDYEEETENEDDDVGDYEEEMEDDDVGDYEEEMEDEDVGDYEEEMEDEDDDVGDYEEETVTSAPPPNRPLPPGPREQPVEVTSAAATTVSSTDDNRIPEGRGRRRAGDEVGDDSDNGGNEVGDVDEVDSPRTGLPRPEEPVSNEVSARQTMAESLLERTEVLKAAVAGGVVGPPFAVFLVLLFIYRMKKKDEGSYALADTKGPGFQPPPAKESYV